MNKPAGNPSLENDAPGVLECPGLKRTRNAGVSWTDSTGTVHDLTLSAAATRTLTLDEAARAPELVDVGFGTYEATRELYRSGRLYPVLRVNARVIRVFACALPDFRRRQLGAAPIRHLAAQRAERVA
jgi:hypothetical protein